jgi:hypothetical protein
MFKLGLLGCLASLIPVGLQSYYVLAYEPAKATVVSVFSRCEIDRQAADRIGKKPRWWDCAAAHRAATAYPLLVFDIEEVDFVTVRFRLADGNIQESTGRRSKLELSEPFVGQRVSIRYLPDEPETVTGLMKRKFWVVIASIGLAGIVLVLFSRFIGANRTEFARKLAGTRRSRKSGTGSGGAEPGISGSAGIRPER